MLAKSRKHPCWCRVHASKHAIAYYDAACYSHRGHNHFDAFSSKPLIVWPSILLTGFIYCITGFASWMSTTNKFLSHLWYSVGFAFNQRSNQSLIEAVLARRNCVHRICPAVAILQHIVWHPSIWLGRKTSLSHDNCSEPASWTPGDC